MTLDKTTGTDAGAGLLRVAGLSRDAELVYEVLVRMPPATGAEIAKATGASLAHLDGVLHRLVTLGLITTLTGTPPRYCAVDPRIALDMLLLEREEQLKRARIRSQELSEWFHQTAMSEDPSELVEVITGRSAITQRVQQAASGAREQLRAMDRPPYAHDPQAPNPAADAALARKLTVRVIYHPDALQIPGRIERNASDARAGEQQRVLSWLPVKLLLVDDRLALAPLLPGPSPVESLVIVHRSALLAALSSYFETLWRLAVPLDLAGRSGGEGDTRPHEAERRMLGLMVAGLPDHAISRQLGLSPRTVQRRIHNLMARFQVQTRFQLAVEAVRHGLIDVGDPGQEQ